jgi:choline transport protein
VLGWQAVTASAAFLAGTMIQGLMVLSYSDYVYKRWHGTLIYWAILILATLFNTVGIRFFPLLEKMILVLHVAFFIAIITSLVVLSPHSSAEYVFTDFENNSGWESDGVAWCLGLLSATYVLVGYDGASHLSASSPLPPTLAYVGFWLLISVQ